jgi:hypothetical protein
LVAGRLDATRRGETTCSLGSMGVELGAFVKWLALAVVALVIGAVGASAVYAWVWHDNNSARTEADEQVVAEAYARRVAGHCAQLACRAENLHRIAPGVWEVTIVVANGKSYCAAIHLDEFGLTSDGGFIGVANVQCS